MKAERERRAQILYAEGTKQSAILTAEGEKQSQILRAEGSAQARILEAQGQARAIQQVFDAIHRGKPTQKLLAYQYLQVLPQIARATPTRCGSSRASSPTPCAASVAHWAPPPRAMAPTATTRTPGSTPASSRTRSTRPSSRTRCRLSPKPVAWPARPARRPPSTPLRRSGSSHRSARPPTPSRPSSRRRRQSRRAAGRALRRAAHARRGHRGPAASASLTAPRTPRYAASAEGIEPCTRDRCFGASARFVPRPQVTSPRSARPQPARTRSHPRRAAFTLSA